MNSETVLGSPSAWSHYALWRNPLLPRNMIYALGEDWRRLSGRAEIWRIWAPSCNLIYNRIPKNASITIRVMLSHAVGHLIEEKDPTLVQQELRSSPLPKLNALNAWRAAGADTFSFVRNPWERLVSCYQDIIHCKLNDARHRRDDGSIALLSRRYPNANLAAMSFEEFTRFVHVTRDADSDKHFRSQCDYLRGVRHHHFIGRCERFAEDLRELIWRYGLPEEMERYCDRRFNQSDHKDYTDYYNDELRRMVAERYAEDIRLLGYRFGK